MYQLSQSLKYFTPTFIYSKDMSIINDEETKKQLNPLPTL